MSQVIKKLLPFQAPAQLQYWLAESFADEAEFLNEEYSAKCEGARATYLVAFMQLAKGHTPFQLNFSHIMQ